MTLRRAVFFDRDGTLMEDAHYCGDPALVQVFPGVPAALADLKRAGFLAFIVTNQSGIGRGIISEAQYHAVHAEFLRQIGDGLGAGLIDATYFCSDAPGIPSIRRKPEPGMVFEAAEEFAVDLARSWFIGDKCIDIECGRRAGTHTVQVLTGYGREQRQQCNAELLAENAVEAIGLILRPPQP